MTSRWGSAAHVRPMSRDEVRTLRSWVITEHWDEGEWDADVLYDIDPEGFWAFLGDDGAVVGGMSIIGSTDDTISLSHLYILPEARGKGITRRCFEEIVGLMGHRMRDGVTITNFSMPPSVELGRPWGFLPLHDEVRMVRRPAPEFGSVEDAGVIDARQLALDDIIAFDAAHAGRERTTLWRRWIALPDATSAAVVAHGRITGLGTIRPSALGHRIGPLFATDPDTADRVMRGLLPAAGGTRVAIDAPAANPDAVPLAERHGFIEEFRTVRLVWGTVPQIPWHECYATVMLHLD